MLDDQALADHLRARLTELRRAGGVFEHRDQEIGLIEEHLAKLDAVEAPKEPEAVEVEVIPEPEPEPVAVEPEVVADPEPERPSPMVNEPRPAPKKTRAAKKP